MMADLFFGVECFKGGRPLSEELRYLHERLTELIASDIRNPDHLRCELINFELALIAPVTHAQQLEEQLNIMRPRCPPWMRHLWRRGV
jgi:hypothetical protein